MGHQREGHLTLFQRLLTLAFLVLVSGITQAQQPFVTDDADVTPRRKFTLQIGNEYDVLQRSAYPALRQNTTGFEIDYGPLKNLEVGFSLPLLGILSSRAATPKNVFGISDSTLHVKYNFYRERPKSRLPAMTIAGVIQFHTGDPSRDLGSGLTDYYINGILQKTVTVNTTLRLNGGILFSGNEQSGALGIKERGRIFTAGGSLVKQFTKKFDLGVEISGAVPGNFDLTRGQLQALVGGNYFVRKNMTFDLGIVGGHFPASPRVGLVLGLTMEF
ncbi:MAG: hypothetical protein QOH42_496 [Blastocatellia bacterium]|jgi:hypothetical protein|nr:hypothetical protein [Blastocatellia bacterium]MDX6303564.1 hypothetical protein [Blastocatellia bacterium]